MAVTEEEVANAAEAAQQAQDAADAAQSTADDSREIARTSRTGADSDRQAANDAAGAADAAETRAAERRGEANAAAAACSRARADEARAQQALQQAQARAQAVHAQYPGECNSETEAADSEVATAQSEVAAAGASAGPVCADAASKEQAARQAEAEAATARTNANNADALADAANDQAELDEQTAREDQAAAQRSVVEAADAHTAHRTIQAEYDAQAACPAPGEPGLGPAPAAPPDTPNQGDAAGHSGQPEPPQKGPGVTGSSLFDLNFTALFMSWKLSKNKWEKAPMIGQVTRGNNHRHTFGGHFTYVKGVRSEEVGGPDTKVTMVGDWRQIADLRFERNAGIKVETVIGDVDETEYANEIRNTPVVRQDKNPTSFAGKGPEFQSISTRAITKFKSKAYDKYLNVRVNANRATYHSGDAFISANNWNQTIGKLTSEIKEHAAKFTDLKDQCTKFKVKSSGFVKMLASGAIKLKAGKFTGRVGDKYRVLASSLAEFKGNIKLGG